jgi:hypothetical protein
MNNNAKLEKIEAKLTKFISELDQYNDKIHTKKVCARLENIKSVI